MPQVKVANPARFLTAINGGGGRVRVGGGTKMRKRKTTRRHNKKANPSKRRVSIKVNGHKRQSTARRRRHNPSTLAGLGLVKDGLYAAGGGLLTKWVRGLVPISFGGQLGDAAITFGVAIGLGEIVGRYVNREAGKMVALGGVTIAATQLLDTYGLTPQALLSRATPAAPPAMKGTSDIVALPRGGYDQYWGSTPNLSAAPKRAGVGNIVAVPRGY
jgi:hypothetical protein